MLDEIYSGSIAYAFNAANKTRIGRIEKLKLKQHLTFRPTIRKAGFAVDPSASHRIIAATVTLC